MITKDEYTKHKSRTVQQLPYCTLPIMPKCPNSPIHEPPLALYPLTNHQCHHKNATPLQPRYHQTIMSPKPAQKPSQINRHHHHRQLHLTQTVSNPNRYPSPRSHFYFYFYFHLSTYASCLSSPSSTPVACRPFRYLPTICLTYYTLLTVTVLTNFSTLYATASAPAHPCLYHIPTVEDTQIGHNAHRYYPLYMVRHNRE